MRWATVILGATLVGLGGCARLPLDRDYRGPESTPSQVRSTFDYPEATPTYAIETLEQARHYTVRRVEFDSQVNVVEPHPIRMDYYDVPGDGPTPVIVVLPILGGPTFFAKHFAAGFARRGFAAVIVHRQSQYKDADQLQQLNDVFLQIVLDHRQALDWIASRDEFDQDRIGLFGISAGGIKSCLLHALDDRIDATVAALAGGDLAYILAYSKEKGIRKRRRKILDEHDITADELYEIVRREFKHDPLNYAPYADARRMLLILARFDRIVPYHKGMELRRRLGGPDTIILPTGHLTAILYVPYIEHAAAAYFRKRFAQVERTEEAVGSAEE
ncbi:MAG: alpha/beta hydrolase [Phycisphaeraceae bacterium]|nr:alpha/beta hydrolase [Phycisphaeraceae bacterium]